MPKTQIPLTPKLGLKPLGFTIIFVVGGVTVLLQAHADTLVKPTIGLHGGDITISAPATPIPAVSSTPTAHKSLAATPGPTPVTTKTATSPKVAYVTRPLPPVKPAPNAPVNNLVPVSQPAPSSSPTPSPTPGQGSGLPPASYHYTSTNWAGYMSPVGSFSAVSGTWTVPTVTGNGSTTTADAAWIGIGGVTTNDLIQVGTADFVSRTGQSTYQAFYETLPSSSALIPSLRIAAGDEMSANIHLVSGTQWAITINDVTRNDNFTIDVRYASTESSAEWIEEDPSYSSGGLVPFNHFGSVNFSGATTTSAGISENLATSGAQAIIMVNHSGAPMATPSGISADGESFSVTGS